MASVVGTQLGPYHIEAAVGAGGMGEVYRARDTRLGRTVAIKILPGEYATDESRQRFQREAQVLSSLSHPHICAIYDIGEEHGMPFIAMEYLEGETLAARLKRGPMSTSQAVQYGIQIADALDKAHRAGIIQGYGHVDGRCEFWQPVLAPGISCRSHRGDESLRRTF